MWEARAGATYTFYENGVHLELDDAIANPLHRDPGDHPVFATREQAEQYSATRAEAEQYAATRR